MSGNNYTKKDLINKIYQNLGFSKNFSSRVIEDFFDIIISELKKSNKIKITSFGTFQTANKRERIGRNPKTKVEAKISARKVAKFKSSNEIKKKLNN